MSYVIILLVYMPNICKYTYFLHLHILNFTSFIRKCYIYLCFSISSDDNCHPQLEARPPTAIAPSATFCRSFHGHLSLSSHSQLSVEEDFKKVSTLSFILLQTLIFMDSLFKTYLKFSSRFRLIGIEYF